MCECTTKQDCLCESAVNEKGEVFAMHNFEALEPTRIEEMTVSTQPKKEVAPEATISQELNKPATIAPELTNPIEQNPNEPTKTVAEAPKKKFDWAKWLPVILGGLVLVLTIVKLAKRK